MICTKHMHMHNNNNEIMMMYKMMVKTCCRLNVKTASTYFELQTSTGKKRKDVYRQR